MAGRSSSRCWRAEPLDRWSLRHDWELVLGVADGHTAAAIERRFEEDQACCRELTLADVRQRSWLKRTLASLSYTLREWLLAPPVASRHWGVVCREGRPWCTKRSISSPSGSPGSPRSMATVKWPLNGASAVCTFAPRERSAATNARA